MPIEHRTVQPLAATLLLGALVAVLLAGCAGATPSASPAGSADPGASAGAGGGGMVDAIGDWRLVEGSSAGVAIPIVEGSDITMTVEGSRVAGRAACNQYGGDIVVADGRVQFGPLSMTEMACAEPIMASEAAFLGALGAVRGATLDGDRLTLAGDDVRLEFERQQPIPAADLTDTDWVLDSLVTLDAVSSVSGRPAELRLGSDGSVTGSTGCRAFTGRWEEANGEIAFSDLAMDQVTCAPDLADQDDHVTTVLGDGFKAEVHGDQLVLAASSGQGLRYHTVTPQVPPPA
jgi:heat shock protein HslJ